jgi:PAS domain S-box-containing protein
MSTTRRRAAADRPHPVEDQLRSVLDAIPALVWLAAPDGSAVHSSRLWLEYIGLSAEQAAGWGWTTAIHRDDLERLTGFWQFTLDSGAAGEIRGRLRRFDGEYRWFLFCTAPLPEAAGGPTGWWWRCGASERAAIPCDR